MSASRIVLVLGGARSGKSAYAVRRAGRDGGRVLFCATAEARDTDMHDRIERHRRERPADWRLVEAPRRLATALDAAVRGVDVVIVDCLTLLVSNLLLEGREGAEARVRDEIEALLDLADGIPATTLLVSNEVGSGIVPDNAAARIYRDLLGMANQLCARRAAEVVLLVAGVPVPVKG